MRRTILKRVGLAAVLAAVTVTPVIGQVLDTAIVTGRFTARGTQDGKELNQREHFTDVFVRRNGRWQAVATHSSHIAAQ